ncbi:MAG: septal ring lytic transglycosylase RlpA family protein [Bacteroidaceae bacterium]|nr:septal ring lytic transglycosylase RlpA family protein [Bacteroidaceae bacterium]
MRNCLSIMLLFLLGANTHVFAEEQDTIIGKASYYSDKLHGRTMSNGRPYHRDSMTCAHLKFPFGTMLKVKNPINDKEVIVTVTDRGPYSKRYIVDLSRAAAKELGLIHRGWAMVEITPYIPQKVPYKLKQELPEIPELNIEYSPIAIYPDPAWKDDSIIARKDVVTGDNK